MKTLRYLLIEIGLISVLGISAQNAVQLPQAQMQSTSVMQGSGSVLPQAASTGTVLTGETPDYYSSTHSRDEAIRKGWGGEGEPGDRPEPYETPIGDGLWAMMFLALAYLIIRVARRRKRTRA